MSYAYLTVDPLSEANSVCRYRIHEKILTLKDDYTIKDESDRPVFFLKAKLWSLADRLLLQDAQGNPLIKIKEEILHLHPTWKILSARDNELDLQLATIKREFTLRERFRIDSHYGEYALEGENLLGKVLTLSKGDRVVAVIRRNYFTTKDHYLVEIDADENQAFIIALVIVINQCLRYF